MDPFSAMACYPQYPYLPIFESNVVSWMLPFSDENRDVKRIKRSSSMVESLRSNNGRSLYSGGRSICRSSSTNMKLAATMINAEEGGNEEERNIADGMRLVQLLIACAEAVACRDKSLALALLSKLRSNALVFGSAFQRVASCFVQGLIDRLSLVQPLGAVGFVATTMKIMDIASDKKEEEALRLVYEICPHIRFGHFFSSCCGLGMALGLTHGHQWRLLIQSLAEHAGKPPSRLRITRVGLCVDRFRISQLGKLDLKTSISEGEALVVNRILQLHCVIIHELSQKVLVLVEQDSSHNGPFFLERFMEALHYYSAFFGSLDVMLPKYVTRRAKMELFYFAEEVMNTVSCEGPARVERHERVDQWRRRTSRAGFQAAPIKMMAQAKQWLVKNQVCDGYTVVEEKGCLAGNQKPIIAASCWKC
ncbi:DELLA protein [Salix suchowensis]|nr:DELLA protein [Salix suchowensis]